MLDVSALPTTSKSCRCRKLKARVAGMFAARGKDFVTQAVDALKLGFEGIESDIHAGYVRRSGGREPWYPRGTEMRNERQLSIVAPTNSPSSPSAWASPRSSRNGSAPISCSTACRGCRCCRPARCCSSRAA